MRGFWKKYKKLSYGGFILNCGIWHADDMPILVANISIDSFCDFREIDPYDMGIRSNFHDHSPQIRHDRKNPSIFLNLGMP
jgi:hypothetical protein